MAVPKPSLYYRPGTIEHLAWKPRGKPERNIFEPFTTDSWPTAHQIDAFRKGLKNRPTEQSQDDRRINLAERLRHLGICQDQKLSGSCLVKPSDLRPRKQIASKSMNSQSDSDLVSIGLPVFNGEKYVAKAIESVLKQSHTNLELIISDNGSTDDTINIIKSYASSDARIKLLFRPSVDQTATGDWESYTNKAYANFQKVLLQSSGTFFCWLAHDNFWKPDFLAETIKRIGKGAGALGGCAMYDHLTGAVMELERMPEIDMSSRKIEQLRSFVAGRRLGTAAAIYGLFNRKALLTVAPRILSGQPFDWLDLYLVSCLITSHGFTIFKTEEPLMYFGYEGAYVEKPVNSISTSDAKMLSKVKFLKAKILMQEVMVQPRAFFNQEIGKRISRILAPY